MVGVVNTCSDLTSADDFLQGDQHQLDGQESHAFIEEVQWAVKEEVPEKDGGEQDLRVRGGDDKHQIFSSDC